jgi:hypothetical protein
MTTTQTQPIKHAINWFEIPVRDIAKARDLYAAMLDLDLEVASEGELPMVVFPHGPGTVSGMLVVDPRRKPGNTGTLIYLDARDGVQRCLARALEAGAKLVQPATPIGPHGTIAVIEDLDGNVIGLHEEPKA